MGFDREKFIEAARQGDLDQIQQMLTPAADVDLHAELNKKVNGDQSVCEVAVIAAAGNENWGVLDAIFQRGIFDIKQFGGEVLSTVVSQCGWHVAQFLINQGVTCQYKETRHRSVLMDALDAAAIDKRIGYEQCSELAVVVVNVVNALLRASTKEERQEALRFVQKEPTIPKAIREIFSYYFDKQGFINSVRQKQPDEIKRQLAKTHDVDIDVPFGNGHTALTFAANAGSVDTLRILLAHPVKPNLKHTLPSGEDVVTLLIYRNNVSGLQLLLDAGAELNIAKNLPLVTKDECLEVFKFIYEKGPVSIEQQQRLLFEALKTGQLEIAKYLFLEKSIQPVPLLRELANDVITAAVEYANYGQPVLINKLNRYYDPGLSAGIYSNNQLAIAKLFLPLQPDAFNPDVFLLAASHGYLSGMQAEWQKSKGRDINCKRLPDGKTALHIVCEAEGIEENKKLEILQFLFEKNADPNATDSCFNTPLIAALRKNHASLVEAMLEKGVNPNVENSDHLTAKDYAQSSLNSDVASKLSKVIQALPRIPYELPIFTARELWAKIAKPESLNPAAVKAELQKPEANPNVPNPSDSDQLSPLSYVVMQWLNKDAYYAQEIANLRATIDCLLEMGADPLQQSGRYQRRNTFDLLADPTKHKRSPKEIIMLIKQFEESKEAVAAKRKTWQQEQQKIEKQREAEKQAFEERLQREIAEASERQKLPAPSKAVANAPALNKQTITKSLASEKTTSNTIWKILGLMALGLLGAGLIGVGVVASFGIIPGVTLAAFGLSLVTSQMAMASLVLGAIALSATLMLSAWMAFSSDDLPEKQPLLQQESKPEAQVKVTPPSADHAIVVAVTPNPTGAFNRNTPTCQSESGQSTKRQIPAPQP